MIIYILSMAIYIFFLYPAEIPTFSYVLFHRQSVTINKTINR